MTNETAIRFKPNDFFDAQEWAALSRLSAWRGLWLVVHAWGVIGICMVAAYFVPWLIPLCIMIVGTRQLGLGILMHDAAHGLLHPNRRINDWVGENLCAAGLLSYRKYHLSHHRLAQKSADPDLVLSAPFPVSKESFRRKVIRDLSGQTYFKQRYGKLARAVGKGAWREAFAEIVRQRKFFALNLSFLAAFSVAGLGWLWVVLWLIPHMCWFALVTRLRNIAEHALIAENEPDPRLVARTTLTNWIGRILVAPYYVNYHCEHHLFMGLPCWTLPRAHRVLREKGLADKLLVAPGYVSVLRAAAGA